MLSASFTNPTYVCSTSPLSSVCDFKPATATLTDSNYFFFLNFFEQFKVNPKVPQVPQVVEEEV